LIEKNAIESLLKLRNDLIKINLYRSYRI